jgi:hypothetical protein
MDLLYAPGAAVTNAFGEMLTSADPRAFSSRYAYDVSPVFDDRPFFFYTVQPRDLWDYLRNANQSSADYKVNRAVPLLFGLMALCVVATGLVMVLPRVVLGTRLPKQKGILTFLTYFLCLGAGYILIQMALIQKFMLLLGQPTRALTVIVFSMLVASGLGSWASRRVVGDADRRLMKVLAGVAALIAALALLSPPLVRTAATWPMVARMVLTVVMIAPVAFFMGMPFPSGLRRLEQRHAPSLRWAWSLNAAASVLGSVGSVVLAIYLGLSATLLTGGALYLVAMLVILVTPREKHPL